MKKNTLLLFAFAILFVGCATSKLSTVLSLQDMEVPPGTMKISNNLYFDRNEIRNIDYLEYLQWTKKVFGTDSPEYIAAVPASKLLGDLSERYTSLDSSYFQLPEYRNLSVLGVSNQQAKLFSKWRSDRVMEFMLIRWKILKWDPSPTKETAFSIEKYFSGNFRNLQPSPYVQYYPVYYLLDPEENTVTGFKTICVYKKWGNE